MSTQIILVLLFTFVIHLISTLAYSVRLVGTRTRKLAVSFALFNILVLVSRTSNSFQAPLLAKWIETNINAGIDPGTFQIRLILLATSVATVVGAVLIPSFQRILSKAVLNFSAYKSIPRLLLHAFSKTGIQQITKEVALPDKQNLSLGTRAKFPMRIFVFNITATAIITVGVLSSLYAGFITPELRTTASSLSAVVNGFATILMFVVIDPYLSVLTDEVVEGKYSESDFRSTIRFMVLARFIGTLLAQFLLLPFAHFIAWVAEMI